MIDLRTGDCLTVMPTLAEVSVDSIVTDPPYGLGFMGKNWDHGVPGVAFWAAALRVLKPGGYMLCFGGTRTYHRLTSAIEDAGWEIRDCIMWVYGSGFPKGKGCLKPAWEPILLARKPGGKVRPLQIDACRVSHNGRRSPCKADGTVSRNSASVLGGGHTDSPSWDTSIGRWPANLIHDGSDDVMESFAEQSAAMGMHVAGNKKATACTINPDQVYAGGWQTQVKNPDYYGDSGSAARFFYCAKASKADRGDGNNHPTVKPTALMQYLCRLITPPGGTVFDPFMGSGSTGKAASIEGFGFIGIEKEPEYVGIAEKRIRPPARGLFGEV